MLFRNFRDVECSIISSLVIRSQHRKLQLGNRVNQISTVCCPRNPCTRSSVCHADKCCCPRNPCTCSSVCHADNAAAPFSFWKAFGTDFPSRRDVLIRLSETRVLFPARLHQRAMLHCEAAAGCRGSSAAADGGAAAHIRGDAR